MKKNIVIVILLLLVLGLAGYLGYDKFLKKEESVKEPKTEIKEESSNKISSLSGNYIYDEESMSYEQHLGEVPIVLELQLNNDNTFTFYAQSTDNAGYKGEYVLNGNKLKLYTFEISGAQEDPLDATLVNSDTIEFIYNEKDDSLTFAKWNWHLQGEEKVEYRAETEFSNAKLTKEIELKHIGKDRY